MLQKKLTEKIKGQSYRSIKQLLMSNTSVKTCWTSTRQSLLTGLLALSCLWPPPHWFYYLCHPCDLERIQSQWLRNKIWVVEKIRGAREKAKAGEWGVSGVLHKTNKKNDFYSCLLLHLCHFTSLFSWLKGTWHITTFLSRSLSFTTAYKPHIPPLLAACHFMLYNLKKLQLWRKRKKKNPATCDRRRRWTPATLIYQQV